MPVKFTFTSSMMKSWLLIHQTSRLLVKSENAALAKIGLTRPKQGVLLAMKNGPSPLTVTNIAQWIDRNPNGISTLVDRMERDGLIRRVRDMPDRREVRLVLTQKGEESFKKGSRLFQKLFRDIFREFSEEELVTLSTIMTRVRRRTFDLLEPGRPEEELQVLDE
jgi:MarR family 2-MHQ and catechol resistance regulon transcriptional repressor